MLRHNIIGRTAVTLEILGLEHNFELTLPRA
uniref:Uncharacterized protein n=1 Tax=Rhizophora mucronata TaxID=61149 RepID=A0A2P2QD18_RHIMU